MFIKTSTQALLGRDGRLIQVSQSSFTHQWLIVAENGPCCASQSKEQKCGPEGQDGHGAAALA